VFVLLFKCTNHINRQVYGSAARCQWPGPAW
jgi:hypothetical protein